MSLHPREVALLLALDSGLQFGVSPHDEASIVASAVACGYVKLDRENREPKQFAHDGEAVYGLVLTDKGQQVAQLMKNELANVGILDINESRPMSAPPVDVTPQRRRIMPA